jgi:tRNA pseudouridine55 synthase
LSIPRQGFVLLDKPAGTTSFSALNALKTKLKTRQVGHTGTLDRFATGLLVVLVGRYTKLAELFSTLDKGYTATITFGVSTDTLDPEGQVNDEQPIPGLEDIRRAVSRQVGEIEQKPPVYSAIHVKGKRAYAIARRGGRLELQARKVTVHRIDVLGYQKPNLEVAIKCSKGTYIRSLARDIGKLAGSCAYLTRLRRTAVGPFRIEDAVKPRLFSAERDLLPAVQMFAPLSHIGSAILKDEAVGMVNNGRPLEDRFFKIPPTGEGFLAIFDRKKDLIAVADRSIGGYRYIAVLATNDGLKR